MVRQKGIQGEVDDTGDGGIALRFLPAELPVGVEGRRGNDDGCVAQGETGVGEAVRLFERVRFRERDQVGCEGVVCGILEVWPEGVCQ